MDDQRVPDPAGVDVLLGGDGDDILQSNGLSTRIFGGNGNDKIHVKSGSGRTTVDGGEGDDTISAIIARGSARVSCGGGNDTVMVSRFPGNRRLVKVAADCEIRKKG